MEKILGHSRKGISNWTFSKLTVAESIETIPWRLRRAFTFTFARSPLADWKGPIYGGITEVRQNFINTKQHWHANNWTISEVETRCWKLRRYRICADLRWYLQFAWIRIMDIDREGARSVNRQSLDTRYGVPLREYNRTLLMIPNSILWFRTRTFPGESNWKGETLIDL